eukprot:jgi/Botrbrau1/22472/Bobra.114_2s0002.1
MAAPHHQALPSGHPGTGVRGAGLVGTKALLGRRQPAPLPRFLLLLSSAVFSALHMLCAEALERGLIIRAKYSATARPTRGGELPPKNKSKNKEILRERGLIIRAKYSATAPDQEAPELMGLVPQDPDEVTVGDLSDEDSRFLVLGSLQIHYKIAMPLKDAGEHHDAVVLIIHGFGCGVFSWRAVQQPLADACGWPVVVFDRPGFGLTSRAEAERGEVWPYTLEGQAHVVRALCTRLGLSRIVLLGHSDGAAVALLAASLLVGHSVPPVLPLGSSVLPVPPPPSILKEGTGGRNRRKDRLQEEEQELLGEEEEEGGCHVVGLGLLEPCLSRHMGRDLLRYKGWKGVVNLQRTLRAHLLDLILRSCWADPAGFTPARKAQYEVPLHAGLRELGLGDTLAQVPCVVVIRGTEDHLAPMGDCRELAAVLSCPCVDLPCGHFAMEEVPGALVDVLVPFVGTALGS